MPNEPRLVRNYRRNRATADSEAVASLEEPVIFSFFALGASRQGLARSIISGVAGGVLGDMVVRGTGEIASRLTEAIVDAVERVAEGAKQKARQEYAYRGSKSIEIEFKRLYFIAIGASVVGIFHVKGLASITSLTGGVRGVDPIVMIPREAISQVRFQDYRGEQMRGLIIRFDDGGYIGFWVSRPPKSGLQRMLLGGAISNTQEIIGSEIYEGVTAAFSKRGPSAGGPPTP